MQNYRSGIINGVMFMTSVQGAENNTIQSTISWIWNFWSDFNKWKNYL